MNELTEEKLKELEELHNNATEGQWRLCAPDEHPWKIGPIEAERQDTVTIVNNHGYGIMCFPAEIGSGHTRDFELAIAAHNSLPALISAARERNKAIEFLRHQYVCQDCAESWSSCEIGREAQKFLLSLEN